MPVAQGRPSPDERPKRQLSAGSLTLNKQNPRLLAPKKSVERSSFAHSYLDGFAGGAGIDLRSTL